MSDMQRNPSWSASTLAAVLMISACGGGSAQPPLPQLAAAAPQRFPV